MKQMIRTTALALLVASTTTVTALAKGSGFVPSTNLGPDLNMEEYFDGRLTATGEYWDRKGNLARTFDVDIVGTWDGTTLTIEEDFVYNTGYEFRRVWTLQKEGENGWVGTANDSVGKARGIEDGPVFSWDYAVNLERTPGEGDYIKIFFEDVLWRVNDRKVVNYAEMKKFGMRVGEVIVRFEKKS